MTYENSAAPNNQPARLIAMAEFIIFLGELLDQSQSAVAGQTSYYLFQQASDSRFGLFSAPPGPGISVFSRNGGDGMTERRTLMSKNDLDNIVHHAACLLALLSDLLGHINPPPARRSYSLRAGEKRLTFHLRRAGRRSY